MESLLDSLTDYLWLVASLIFLGIALLSIHRRRQRFKVAQKKLEKAVKASLDEPLTLHPLIDLSKCTGCAACTTACPEGDILQLINHQAVLVSPTKCVGHGECERACPKQAISLVFGTKKRGMDIPRISADYETNVPGLYIAGELGGMGLIRNAVRQGSHAAGHALSKLAGQAKADVDLLIVGAGPAGIAASLRAIAEKKSYLCLEQNSFGGTVANFPRQKIVMSVPMELPLFGQIKFKNNKVSKEELLAKWSDVRSKAGLRIQEHTAFQSVEPVQDVFHVTTNRGLIKAKKVILAMGVRGSPRRLGLPSEDLPKVTYSLIDPEQYQSKDVAVIGGGNAGVEAAQMLARKDLRNRVTLLVRGANFDRCNEENQQIIRQMEGENLLEIWFESSVAEIHPDSLKVKRQNQTLPLKNDFLFIFAGAELPHKMLMGFGIAMDKKFGEGLSKTS